MWLGERREGGRFDGYRMAGQSSDRGIWLGFTPSISGRGGADEEVDAAKVYGFEGGTDEVMWGFTWVGYLVLLVSFEEDALASVVSGWRGSIKCGKFRYGGV